MPTEAERVTVPHFLKWKSEKRKISVLTAYDYPTARLLDSAGVDCVLVGIRSEPPSRAGKPPCASRSRRSFTTQRWSRGHRPPRLVIADLPFLSFQVSPPGSPLGRPGLEED